MGLIPKPKEKMLPASYSENIAAVQEILESASEENILVLVYIAPFITEIENPYVTEEYINFKRSREDS